MRQARSPPGYRRGRDGGEFGGQFVDWLNGRLISDVVYGKLGVRAVAGLNEFREPKAAFEASDIDDTAQAGDEIVVEEFHT